jgi:hypothetical protein
MSNPGQTKSEAIHNTSRKHVNYEEDKNKVPMNRPYNRGETTRIRQMGGGLDYYFLLFIVPLNPFGIKFMSKNRFDCVCFISRFVNKLPSMLPRTRF